MTAHITTFAAPILISTAYVGLYYAFQINILRTKTRLTAEYKKRGEKFDRYYGEDREMLAADRFQLNMLEHMPPFMLLLWLNAVFVGPFGASIAGAIYLAARLYYPFAMGGRLGRGPRNLIIAATLPGYLVMAYFLIRLVVAVATAT